MGGRWILGVSGILLLTAALAGEPTAMAAPSPVSSGWAALIENDWYAGHYPDLPVGYINSTRMLNMLIEREWPADHILLIRDSVDGRVLRRAVGWLADRVRPGDTALLYVAGEYSFFTRDLQWAEVLPPLWRRVQSSHRVLIAETCFAERLTSAVEKIPGIALPATGRDEWDWWGLRETGGLMRGAIFTYYLTQALAAQPRNAPLAFGAAFADAVANAQTHFRNVIAQTPGALDSFHAIGQFPERLPAYPNPHLTGSDAAPPGPVLAEASSP